MRTLRGGLLNAATSLDRRRRQNLEFAIPTPFNVALDKNGQLLN